MQRLLTVARLMNARRKRANARDLKLREQNRKRYASENRKMQSRAGGSAQSFRGERIRSTADAGSGRGGSRCSKGRSGAQNRSHISGILDPGQDDK